MAYRKFWPLVSLLGLLVLAGCGGTSSITPSQPTPAAKPEFLYVRTLTQNPSTLPLVPGLATFKLDSTSGVLTSTATTSLDVLTLGFAVNPAAKFLYVSNFENGPGDIVNIFSIDPASGVPAVKGQYAPLNTICSLCPPAPNGPGPLAIDPAGKFLFYGSSVFGPPQVVGVLAVDGTGMLSAAPGSPFPADLMPFAVAVHPSGRFVYTENVDPSILIGNTTTNGQAPTLPIGLKSISGFSVAENGALTAIPGSPFPVPSNLSLTNFLFHPSGKFVFLTGGTPLQSVYVWSVDQTTGELSAVPGSPFGSVTLFTNGAVHPNGKFVYFPDLLDGLTAFSIDANTGVLTELGGIPGATGQRYANATIDPSGNFLFVTDVANETIVEFKVDTNTGSLTAQGTPTPLGALTQSMTIVKAP
ncbi:MAG TPA: beta-propeller fold lactonase family protein [Terriglobales bacterium]|nr:beta-propeller fold lactonase family protein [Terriglobales bacterium]